MKPILCYLLMFPVLAFAQDMVTMPDGKILDAGAKIEYLIDAKTGAPSTWSTGNNYAVPETPHAANQVKMMEQINKYLPGRMELKTATAAEFLGAMSKLAKFVEIMSIPIAIFSFVLDAESANEGADLNPYARPEVPHPWRNPGEWWAGMERGSQSSHAGDSGPEADTTSKTERWGLFEGIKEVR